MEILHPFNIYYVYHNVISDEMCDKLIAIGKTKWKKAKTLGEENRKEGSKVIRASKVTFTNKQWVYDLIWELMENANKQAAIMQSSLEGIKEETNHIGDVRGLGPMIGVEIVHDKESKKPAKDITQKILDESKNRGLLLVSCGLEENVIRFMGPLTTPLSQVEEAMKIFAESIKSI